MIWWKMNRSLFLIDILFISLLVNKIRKEFRFCHKLKYYNNLRYFKLTLFDLKEIIVWNIKCLQQWVTKKEGLENQSWGGGGKKLIPLFTFNLKRRRAKYEFKMFYEDLNIAKLKNFIIQNHEMLNISRRNKTRLELLLRVIFLSKPTEHFSFDFIYINVCKVCYAMAKDRFKLDFLF